MDLCLQYGYGMGKSVIALLRKWRGGTVILSPRDLTPDQLPRFAEEFVLAGATILIDTQLYDPRANHERLRSHNYWPKDNITGLFSDGSAIRSLLRNIAKLNEGVGATSVVLPGLFCDRASDDWFSAQERIIGEAGRIWPEVERLGTVCLSSETLRSEEQVEDILTRSDSWDVSGYYVIAEHPNGQYLVDDPMWLGNLLVLCSGLKLQGKRVIVGYAGHQMLCLSTAKVDALASGTWLNVRAFNSAKFNNPSQDSISRRAKWYYSPQSLTEYKIPFLDLAHNAGILTVLQPDTSVGSQFADVLFSGAQPSVTSFSESQSALHYLQCLRSQCLSAERRTFRETLHSQELLLQTAEQLIKVLHTYGVRGQERDFLPIIDVNRAALAYIEMTRGFVLDREWNRI